MFWRAAAALPIFLSACGFGLCAGNFSFNNGAEPATLDPVLMTGVPEMTVARELFEGLTRVHPGTLEPIPGIANSWEISGDGLTYSFHLREAKWSDGRPVRASDFLYSWERVLSPKTAGSYYAYLLFTLKGARAYNEGKQADFGIVGVRAPDERTLVVTLAKPTAYFLDLTSFSTLVPLNRSCIGKHGERWTRPGNIVTNGPYLLKSHEPQKDLVLQKNPGYWNAKEVALDTIRIFAVEDSETGLMMYMAGETDWTRSIPLAWTDKMKGKPDYHSAPYFGTYFYRFNVKKPPLDNPLVRKALAMAIDKDAICKYILKAGQQPAANFVPPMINGYIPPKGLPFDVGKAKELLKGAGFPEGRGMRKLSILYNTSDAHKRIAEAIQQMWKKSLGIEVELVNQEWKVYLATLANLDYDMARSAWIGDYLDPNTFLDMFVTDGGNNRTGWGNRRYDELIDSASERLEPDKRMGLFHDAEELLVEQELPIIPIYFYVSEYMLKPGVKGFLDNPLNIHPLASVSWGVDR